MTHPAASAATKARTLISLKRPDEAVKTLTAALALEPESAELLRLLAQAQSVAGRYAEACTAARAAIAVDPDNEWGHRLLSVAYGGLGEYDNANRAAAEAQRLAPDEWRTHSRRALASAQAGRSGDGILAGQRAVQLGFDEPDAHFSLGFAYAKQNRPEEAEAAYRRVLELRPDHAAALNNLGALQLRKRGGLWRANRHYGAALASDAQLAIARRNLDAVARGYMRRFHLTVFVACLIVRTVFLTTPDSANQLSTSQAVSRSSRIAAGTVGGVALLLLLAAVIVLDRRLPRNLRRYYRRLPRNDRLLGLWLLVDVGALIAVCLVAIPTTYGGQMSIATVASVLLIAGVALSWLPRLLRGLGRPSR